jgi:hypothetical protein
MGASASITDEFELYSQLKATISIEQRQEVENLSAIEYDEEEEEESRKLQQPPNQLFEKVNQIYKRWLYRLLLHEHIMFTPLLSFEFALEKAFSSGLTPIISDCSEDHKVCTFYGYQTGAVIMESKLLITESIKMSPLHCLEILRRTLVNAMKYGKLLVIRLDTFAPDFLNKWNDTSQQIIHEVEKIGFFPLETFYEGGKLLRTDDNYAKLLFREEDMKPHKNVAFCRNEFRVCLVTKFSPEEIDQHLFAVHPDCDASDVPKLPPKKIFQVISINYETEEE